MAYDARYKIFKIQGPRHPVKSKNRNYSQGIELLVEFDFSEDLNKVFGGDWDEDLEVEEKEEKIKQHKEEIEKRINERYSFLNKYLQEREGFIIYEKDGKLPYKNKDKKRVIEKLKKRKMGFDLSITRELGRDIGLDLINLDDLNYSIITGNILDTKN